MTKAPISLIPPHVMTNLGGDMLTGKQYLRSELASAVDGGDTIVARQKNMHDAYREKFEAVVLALRTADPTKTPEAGLLDIRAKATKVLDALAQRGTEATNATKQAIAAIDAEIEKQLALSDGPHGTEIRGHMRSIKKANDRLTFAHEAIKSGDTATVGAILSAPAYLSGLSEKELSTLRKAYTEKHCGELVARQKNYETTMEINFHAFNQLLDAFVGTNGLFAKSRIAEIEGQFHKAESARESIWGA